MTWISGKKLNRIKKETDLAAIVRARGIELKPHGADLIGHCPFHDDRTPSFVVSPSKNLWHCLGACNEGGSVIDFLVKLDGISVRHALVKLNGTGNHKHNLTPLVKDSSTDSITTQKLLHRVVDYYHRTLLHEKEGIEYLKKRGVYSPEAVKKFKIGLANRTLGYVVPRDSEFRKPLQDVGIFNKKTGHELFAGSVVFPIIDKKGTITEMYGRKSGRALRKGTALHLYLPGPHKGVWNNECFAHNESIILCESAIDALTFWVHGFTNVTFSYGVAGFTDDHLQLFKEHTIKEVFIAYDMDDAGNNAASTVSKTLSNHRINTYRLRLPRSMDINLYAQKVTPAKKALEVLFEAPDVLYSNSPPLAASKRSCQQDSNASEPFPLVPDDGIVVAPEAAKGKSGGASDDSPACSKDGPINNAENTTAKEKNEGGAATQTGSGKELEVKKKRSGLYLSIGDRDYRIRGLEKNKSYEVLKVSLRVAAKSRYYLDTVDLVQERQRRLYIQQAADELECNKDMLKRDMGKILLTLEELQEEYLEADDADSEEEYQMSASERKAAHAYLKSPNIIERLLHDFHTCGIVNEDTNLLIGYLATLSRKFDDPLAIMFQSSPGSGKSTVMDAILEFVPEEDKRVYTYMTGQSLFYVGENDLKHKVLAIEEDEGAEKASYSLKTMQSEKRISISSTGTDPHTGRNKAFTTTVNGPVAIMSCTTKPFVEEELMLRFLALGADESRAQTRAVLQRQRENETMQGIKMKEKSKRIQHLHQNIQRCLGPVHVVNPYADKLTFPSNSLRTRRDQKKYLTIIRAIAFLYQYQRKRSSMSVQGEQVEYIEVTPQDIKQAYTLCCHVMGRTLDELAPQSRNLLNMLVDMVRHECERLHTTPGDYRFGQKEVRDYTGWSAYQVKVHMRRLVELEYVYSHRGCRGRLFEYELVYAGEGDSGKKFVLGIANLEAVSSNTTTKGASKSKVGGGQVAHR